MALRRANCELMVGAGVTLPESVTTAVFCGETLPMEVSEETHRQPGVTRVVNAYGPTEGTVVACAHTMTHADQVGAAVPIGRAIAHTRVLVLDRARRPAPIGIPGEIWIGGDGVARGPVGEDELRQGGRGG